MGERKGICEMLQLGLYLHGMVNASRIVLPETDRLCFDGWGEEQAWVGTARR